MQTSRKATLPVKTISINEIQQNHLGSKEVVDGFAFVEVVIAVS
jgi:hypothetical protein